MELESIGENSVFHWVCSDNGSQGTVALIFWSQFGAAKSFGSSGFKQSRDELDLREDTCLLVMDMAAFDGSYCFYAAQGRLS